MRTKNNILECFYSYELKTPSGIIKETNKISYDVVECEKHIKLSRTMAQESIILLKNNGILPLKNTISIALIGPNADEKSVLLGNYNGTPTKFTTVLKYQYVHKKMIRMFIIIKKLFFFIK